MDKPHKSCFGSTLPSVLGLRTDKPNSGKAFSVILRRHYGTFISERRLNTDLEQWGDCRACEEFQNCHQPCTTRGWLERRSCWQTYH